MTNKYLEKIASVLSKEGSRKVQMEPEDNWKHAPKSTAVSAIAGLGGSGAIGKSLYHDSKALHTRAASDFLVDRMKSKRYLKAGLGLAALSVGTSMYSNSKTRKAIDKKYEVHKK